MKGKGKKILSLALVLVLVVQLFVGLGNEAQAETVNEITVTGLGGYSASRLDGNQEQIGFAMSGTIPTATWVNATILGDGFLLNGEQKGASQSLNENWYIQTTDSGYFVLTNTKYVPAAGDVISIPQDMQFQINGTTNVYKITNSISIKYDGTKWHECQDADTLIINDGLTGVRIPGVETTPEQIGFAITKNIVAEFVKDWITCSLTGGSVVLLNGAPRSDWKIDVTTESSFNLVCWNYAPVSDDVITIPAGTQFTCGSTIYEFQYEYSIAYNGEKWVVKPIMLTLGELQTTFAVADTGSTWTYQFRVKTDHTNAPASWTNDDNDAKICWNGTDTTGMVTWDDHQNGVLFIQVAVEKTEVVKKITLKAGTQYKINYHLYEIAEDYTVYYYEDGFHEVPQEATPIAIQSLHNTFAVVDTGSTWTYQFRVYTDHKGTEESWIGNDKNATLLWNDKNEATGEVTWEDRANGLLFVQLAVDKTEVVESITLKAGTQYTINNNIYEVQNDYQVYYYDGGLHTEPKPEAELIEIQGIYKEGTYQNPNNSTIWEIRLITEPSVTENTWQLQYILPGAVNGNSDGRTQICWVEGGYLYLQPELSENETFNSLTIKAGTQFTNAGTSYEIVNDYTIYHKDGVFSEKMLYDITQKIDGTEQVIPATGTYTLPEIPSKEGHVALGWKVNEDLYKVGTTLTEKAEGYIIEAVYAEFSQLKGAQVRVSTANEKEKVGGIRFVCKLAKNSISDYITKMGVLVMPTDYMTADKELKHNNYQKQTEQYGTVKGYREFTLNKEDMKLGTIDSGNDETSEEAYYLKASIVNLYSYNYTRSYSARSFLAVQYAGEEEPTYVYTDYSKEDNERRICDIAKKMIETDPNEYGPAMNKYPIVYKYAKVADTMESFAFFGPKAVVTDGVYDEEATINAMKTYANMGFKYLLMDDDAYHIDGTYTTTTWEQEQEIYNDPTPRLPQFYLKKTMEIARQLGLEVIVNDAALIGLSKINIPLVETAESKDQVIAACLMYLDGNTVELLGEDIDESKFDVNKTKYTYDGQETTVLHYVEQFDNYEALKNWVAIKMSAYAKEDNFRGVRLVDEPSSDQFAAVALMTKVIKELYPNAYVQSSSLQSYSTRNDIEEKYTNWVNYWNNLLDTHTNATEVGINFYPYRKGDEFDHPYKVHDNYLSSLQKLATTTQDRGLNLEFTIQAYANESGYLTVDAAKLALQMHLALAFGTDNLGYFRYSGLGVTENGGGKIDQTIESDPDLAAAVLSANRNGNYLKSHMTFFEYQDSMVFNKDKNEYVTIDNYESGSFDHVIKEVLNSAPILINQFKNEHTGQYGYYVVNLAKLHDTRIGMFGGGTRIQNDPITITLKQDCVVYQDYTQYAYDANKNEEVTNKVNSVTLSDGQGAFIVVD